MTRVKPIRVFVDPVYGSHAPTIAATLLCLLEIAGWRSEVTQAADNADISYLLDGSSKGALRGILPKAWSSLGASQPSAVGAHIVPHVATLQSALGEVDWIAVAAFFLGGLHELDRTIFDCADAWATPGAPAARWGLTGGPVLHEAVAAVTSRVNEVSPNVVAAPRWPTGKRYAVALSHDLDRYRRFRASEFLAYAWKTIGRGQITESATSLAKSMASAFARRLRRDPFVRSLDAWTDFEHELGIRAAIYVAVTARADPGGAGNDVTYSLRDSQLVSTLQRIEERGWEIGLHSSINAWRKAGGYGDERLRLHRAISARTVGVRGHYWSLDPGDREESLRRIGTAGFLYDSSLGMNVVHGYRRGINYPYQPFDRRDGSRLGVWEVPPVVMDQSLFLAGRTNEERRAALQLRVDEVRRNNGLLVLDWHTDSLAPGYMEESTVIVLDYLRQAAADSSCWIAPPRQIAEWCAQGRWHQ